MPTIKKVGSKVQLDVERFDGGLNTKESPSRISEFESPDLLNVVFDDQGSVKTRNGHKLFNTGAIGTSKIDGQFSYNGTMVVAAGGDLYRSSGTTFVTVPSAQGQLSSGAKVAGEVYQGILFLSDGTGAWRYEGGDDFYQMGIGTPSACTGSGTSAGNIAADTYYYKVSYVNSGVVEGEAGSSSVGVTIGASSVIGVTDVPIAAASLGVASRKIYRSTAAAGTYGLVGTIADNTATTFADTVAVGSETTEPVTDATAPTPWTTVKLHQERLFFDDSSDRTILRYTSFQNPYVSKATEFMNIAQGDFSNITAIGVQDDFVNVFKSKSIWIINLVNASDDTTWQRIKSPSNLGIVGPKALCEVPNGIVFVGKLNGRISGLHLLSGVDVIETADDKLRTRSISERIEPDILAIPSSLWDDMACVVYNNIIYIATGLDSADTTNKDILWFDINRLGDKGQPGSWSKWDNCAFSTLLVHDGNLYAGSSAADGQVFQLENSGQYYDQLTGGSTKGINSYFWTRPLGGESAIDSWIKDFRFLNVWHGLLGTATNKMNVRRRKDGSPDTGDATDVSLSPGGGTWGPTGNMVWGTSTWGGNRTRSETQISVGPFIDRRMEVRFDNQYNASAVTSNSGSAFQVFAMKALMNLRRQR